MLRRRGLGGDDGPGCGFRATRGRQSAGATYLACSALGALLLVACDGAGATDAGDSGLGDSGGGDADTWTVDSLTLEAPAPPVLTPCPAGFREVRDDGPVPYCDPWPASGHEDGCGIDEAHFPGEPGCAAVGAPCPAGDFATDLPTDRTVVFVTAGGSPGDGSRERPHPSLASVSLAALPPDSVLALSVGAHRGFLAPRQDLEVVGACASGTTLQSSGEIPAAMVAWGANLTVRNLRIDGPPGSGGIDAIEGGSLFLDGVVLDGLEYASYIDSASSLTAQDLIIRDMAPGSRYGVYVEGTATVTRAVIERAHKFAFEVDGPTASATLERVAIRETTQEDGEAGTAVTTFEGASVTVREFAFEENHFIALGGDGATARVEASDGVIRGTGRNGNGYEGHGMTIGGGGTLTATRVFLDGNHGNGFAGGLDEEGLFIATDVVIRGGVGSGGPSLPAILHGDHGRGIDLGTDIRGEVERVLIEDNAEAGVVLAGPGASLAAMDLVIRGTRPRANGSGGRGLNIQNGGHATVTRALFEDNNEVSVFVHSPGSSLELRQSEILRTVAVNSGTTARGVNAQGGGTVVLSGVRVRETREVAVAALGGGVITGSDFEVFDSFAVHCTPPGCPSTQGGSSLGSVDGSRLELTRFSVDGGTLCGAQVAEESELVLRDGRIARHLIGACVQVDGFDLSQISDSVSYVDNGVNLDSTTLPVPQVVTP